MNTDPLIGCLLANFRIERVLGRGGMAQVYYGQDVKLERPAAIKVIDARHRGKPAYAQRFVKEARAVARWRHENIIQIYYADDQDDLYFYAMEYIDGQDLSSILAAYSAQGGLMPEKDVLRVARAIASALDYAHERNVIHRDVKPSNVLVANDGRIVLGDFGLAFDMREGSIGEAFGSPHYISPEQARRSSDVVPQSDLYSLGIILYEMLTGFVPFNDPSPTSIALQHITQPPPAPRSLNPRLSEAVERVLLKAIQKLPQERYQSGAALVADLQSALALEEASPQKSAALPLSSMPAAQVSVESPPGPRRRKGFFAALLLFLLLSLFAAAWFGRDALPFSLWAAPLAAVTETILAPPLTNTPPPAPTATATLLPPSPIPILVATPTLPPPTETPSPTPAEPLPTATPTVKHVSGQRMWMFYDASGFYLYNASINNRSISQFSFERLGENDEILNSFGGWQWERLYRVLHPGRCMRLEIRNSPVHLRPQECGNRFLASFTYGREDAHIFWTESPESTQFRVLGQSEEVGRCEIAHGFCEVFIP